MNIKEILSCYLEENKRVKVKLYILIHQLANYPNPLKVIAKATKSHFSMIRLFKIIILIHECLTIQMLPILSTIELMKDLVSEAENKKSKKSSPFQQLLFDKTIQPYVLYLQKKLYIQEQKNSSQQEQMFQMLNLLKRGTSFAEILYTFGRYYLHEYTFIVDFNILMAKDINSLYDDVKISILKCKYLYDDVMRMELESIHQKMYIIFYNCYFYREVKEFIPKWLETEKNKSNKNIKSLEKRQPTDISLFKSKAFDKKISFNQDEKFSAHKLNMSSVSTLDNFSSGKNTSTLTKEEKIWQANQSTIQGTKICYDEDNLCNSMLLDVQCRELVVEETVEDMSENEQEREDILITESDKDRIDLLQSMERVIALFEDEKQ